jgi:hypothetical protein
MGFNTKNDFINFSMYVIHQYRYALNEESRLFLQNVAESVTSRIVELQTGTEYWRSQIGYKLVPDDNDADGVTSYIYPYSVERMTPSHEYASDGRVNPKGITALYLSSTRETAMSEVRPWLRAEISCARFLTTRLLRIVDCSKHAEKNLLGWDAVLPEEVQEAVWASIDRGFSRPVDSAAGSTEYIPTQILSELFKSLGFDGVRYKSALHDGHNLALFNVDMAKMVDCQLFDTKRIVYEFSEASDLFLAQHGE